MLPISTLEAQKSTPEAPKSSPDTPKSTPEAPEGPKQCQKVHRERPESVPGVVWGDFGRQKSSSKGPKSNEKRAKKRLENLTFFGIVFGTVFYDFGGQKRR